MSNVAQFARSATNIIMENIGQVCFHTLERLVTWRLSISQVPGAKA